MNTTGIYQIQIESSSHDFKQQVISLDMDGQEITIFVTSHCNKTLFFFTDLKHLLPL